MSPYHRETSDANFFSLVHHVLESGKPSPTADDRRESHRRGYTCMQYIAPYAGGHLPKQSEFVNVQCLDLSASGFSFIAAEPPSCEYMVVALGSAPYIFVSARVVRTDRKLTAEGEHYLIGCRFVTRIKGVVYGHRLGQREN